MLKKFLAAAALSSIFALLPGAASAHYQGHHYGHSHKHCHGHHHCHAHHHHTGHH